MSESIAQSVRGGLVTVRHKLRRRFRLGVRWLLRARLDIQDTWSGARNPLLPPRRMNLPSQISAVGERIVDTMIELGPMGPDAAVLDIGCGPGRAAAPLSRYLDPDAGSYEGFDVMPRSIGWCTKAITPRHPSFHFQVADLHNAQYNPGGRQRADEYVFPYTDAGFDAALAASLFTHLRPFEARRYLQEAARVLRPGARLFGTWFLLNDESRAMIAEGRAQMPGLTGDGSPIELNHFTDERGHEFSSPHADVPEFMIVADEELVRELHEEAGLRIVSALYGHWTGRQSGPEQLGQDLLIAERV